VGQNLKGMVKSIETANYTPDSTGAIGEMDSCCIGTELYDEKGYTTGYSDKTKAGAVSSEMMMTRHAGGQAQEITNKKDGKKTGSFKVDIDANGKYSKATEYDSVGKLTAYYTDIVENDFGKVTSVIKHNPDSSVKESFKSVYKDAIFLSNSVTDSLGKTVSEYKVELNDKGDAIKGTYIQVGKDSTTTTVETFTYDSYDEQGNWTQRTTYNDKGKATKVVKRTITYYKKE
jgi:hypothetical protein